MNQTQMDRNEKSALRRKRVWSGYLVTYRREILLLVTVLGLGIIFSVTSPDFLTGVNLWNLLVQASPLLAVSFGMTIVIASGNIDLSVGSIASLVGVVCVQFMTVARGSFGIAIIVGLAAGALVGALNGWLTAYLRVPSFIATLGTMTIIRGTSFVLSGGYDVQSKSQALFFLFGGSVIGIPFPVIVIIILGLFTGIFLTQFRSGRKVLAIGGNPSAARLSGLKTKSITIGVLTSGALFAAVGGLLTASRTASGSPSAGEGWELQAIATVILGGANLFGGRANVVGTVLAGIIIGMISNWMSLVGLQWWLQGFVEGSLLILVVAVGGIRAGKNGTSRRQFA